MKVIILAGGRGTRLQSRVADRPKPMAEVAGRPFLAHVMDPLVQAGVSSITLATGYLGHLIAAHFGDSYQGTPLHYVQEASPLGTGGGMLWALENTPQAEAAGMPWLVLNGDTFIELDHSALWAWHQAQPPSLLLAMVLRQVPDVARFGAVTVANGRAVGLEEKGRQGAGLINAGVYLVRRNLFDGRSPGTAFSFEQDILQKACTELHPPCFVSDGFFIDMGLPEELDRAQHCFPRGGSAMPS